MCMNVCHLCHLCHLGRTELHNAVCSGDKDYFQQLLKNRASVDATVRNLEGKELQGVVLGK